MSTKLGSLTLDLIAKIGNFTGPIKNAENQTKISFENMRKSANLYGTAIAGVAASGVVALAGMAVQTANQAAELEKFAFRANTTTQDFQKMAVGAGAFGIEQEKLSDMMKDFNEKLGELTAIGAGGGVDFFEKIAVKTEGSAAAAEKLILKMQKLSGPEALQLYIDKLEEAGVPQQQMSFYLESMASDMTDLIPLLVNGGEGMKLYGDLAERAGIIMSDQTIESAKALKDQVYMLDLQMQGAKNQLMQAVIPAFVDIAEAFLGSSEQGLQFTDVAEGVATSLKGVASVAIGAVTAIQLAGKALGGMAAIGGAIGREKDWYEIGPIGLAKAAYDARGEIAALGKEIKGDMHQTVMGAADRLDKLWNAGTSTTAKQLRGIREVNQGIGSTNSGLKELSDKQNEAAKSAGSHNAALREQQRIAEQLAQDRESIAYNYSSENKQKELDLEKEIQFLQKAGMTSYVDIAKNRYNELKKLAEMQFAWEVTEHRLTENQKLAYSFNIREQEIKSDIKLTNDQRELKLKSLDELYAIEQNALKISQAKELLEIKRNWMSAGDYARDYYAIVRQEILSTASYSPEKKQALVQQTFSQESDDRDNALGNYYDAIGVDNSLEIALADRNTAIEEAWKWQLITQEEYQDQLIESERKYHLAKANIGMISAENTLGAWTGILGDMLGEQSSAYQAMFALEKGFAVARALMNVPETYSNVYANVSKIHYVGPYIAPVMAAAAAAAQVVQASQIKSISMQAYATGGLITGEGTGTSDDIPIWASNGEFMMKASTVKAIGADTLNAINSDPSLMGTKVLDIGSNSDIARSMNSVKTQPQIIDNKVSVIMVEDQRNFTDKLYGSDGEKAYLYHHRRNKSKL